MKSRSLLLLDDVYISVWASIVSWWVSIVPVNDKLLAENKIYLFVYY